MPWLGYVYIKSQEPGFQPQPNCLPQFGANYAVSLNLILFIFYFEIVLALPFLQSCKEYKISESLYYKRLGKLERSSPCFIFGLHYP